jgi:xanthine/uracil permease
VSLSDVSWGNLGFGFVVGIGVLAIWHLGTSIWGWYRGESYGYSSGHSKVYWDRARFRHGLAVLTLLYTVAANIIGWQFWSHEQLIGFVVGTLLLFCFPLPAQILVLAFKLYSVRSPRTAGGGSSAIAGSGRSRAGGRDP